MNDRGKDEGGKRISAQNHHDNKGVPGPKVKFKPVIQTSTRGDSLEQSATFPSSPWEIVHREDIYCGVIAELRANVPVPSNSSVNELHNAEDIYSDAASGEWTASGSDRNHVSNNIISDKDTVVSKVAQIKMALEKNLHFPEKLQPDKIHAHVAQDLFAVPVQVTERNESTEEAQVYDDFLEGPASDRLTESCSEGSGRDRKIGNPSDVPFEFVSSTQSLPPNMALSGHKARIGFQGDSSFDSLARIQEAKRKSLTLKRTRPGESFDEGSYTEPDENIYESVYLQLPENPDQLANNNNDTDSDDISWSSDEFESYEDSIHSEADPVILDRPLMVGPPTARVARKAVASDGGLEAQHPSLLRRLKDSFRGPADTLTTEEFSPCLPVEICDTKHPPPELPPLPSGLSQNQVKRRHALGVLIDSEKSYINSLQRLNDDYRDVLMEVPLLHRGKVRVELLRAAEILQYHRMFQIELAEQVKLWHTQEKIGDVFTASFSKSMVFDAYSEYVNNFTVSMEDIKKVTRQRTSLQNHLKSKEMTSPDRLGLFGLMVKPVQRFPQFITCLQDLLKYTPEDHHDRLGLQRALTELENIAHKLNERKRQSEQILEAKVILSKFKENVVTRTGHEERRKLIRVDDLDQVIEASNKFKKRRLILLNDILILATVSPSRDGFEPERYKMKWWFPLRDVELKESSLSSSMQSSVRGEPGMITVVFSKPENPADDPFHLVSDLSELHHDYSVLTQVVGLVSTLKRSYSGLTEECIHGAIRDLQRVIHVKDEQLRLVKSCSITLSVPCRTVTGGIGRTKYVFHTQSPSARQDWCLDLQIAKMALDAQNNPGWHLPQHEDVMTNQMPALFIKALPVDVVRHYTKVRCAVPVYLASQSNIGAGMQHLWVCNTTDTRGQVAIVSIHADRPRVIESYQACDCQILCAENVPGYCAVESPYAFNMDTVWMVTINKQVLIYPLTSSDGLTKRQPAATFTLPAGCSVLRYADDHVFAGLDDGQLAVYSRDDAGVWDITSPLFLRLGDRPVSCLLCLENHVLATSGNQAHFVSLTTLQSEHSQSLSPGGVISHMARAGVGLFVAYEDRPMIYLHHLETLAQLQDVNVSSAVQKALTGRLAEPELLTLARDIHVSCLLASKGLLWIGTSHGVVLTLPLPRLREGVPQIGSRPCVSFHGQNGPIRFLLPIFCLSPTMNTLKRKSVSPAYDYVQVKGQEKEIRTAEEVREERDSDLNHEADRKSEQSSINVQNTIEKDESVHTASPFGLVNGELGSERKSSVQNPSQTDEEAENVDPDLRAMDLPHTDNGLSLDTAMDLSHTDNGLSLESATNLPLTDNDQSLDRAIDLSPIDHKQLRDGPMSGQRAQMLRMTSEFKPNKSKKMSMWKSTPNLAADMEGTEDISLLYGSLMRGIDVSPQATGVRRKNKRSWRGKQGSYTLDHSASVSEENTFRRRKRSLENLLKKKSDHVFSDPDSVYDLAEPFRCSEQSEESDQNRPTDENLYEDTHVTSEPSRFSESEDILSSSRLNDESAEGAAAVNQDSEPVQNTVPTLPWRRSEAAGEGTLSRQSVQTCKSVIVVSGGDGYYNWNLPAKSHKSEEATLLLWLHKVSS